MFFFCFFKFFLLIDLFLDVNQLQIKGEHVFLESKKLERSTKKTHLPTIQNSWWLLYIILVTMAFNMDLYTIIF